MQALPYTNDPPSGHGDKTARLPAEIIDRIIDFLHDDSTSLAYCSQVCKLWLPTASFHLFRSLHVRTSGPMLSTSKRWQVPNEPDVNRRACLALLRDLERSVRLHTHIVKLHLEVDCYGVGLPGIELSLLGKILTALPRLRSLHINTPHLLGPSSYSQVIQLPCKYLQKLCFSRARLSLPLFEVIRWYTRIDTLVLRRIQDTDDNLDHASEWFICIGMHT